MPTITGAGWGLLSCSTHHLVQLFSHDPDVRHGEWLFQQSLQACFYNVTAQAQVKLLNGVVVDE